MRIPPITPVIELYLVNGDADRAETTLNDAQRQYSLDPVDEETARRMIEAFKRVTLLNPQAVHTMAKLYDLIGLRPRDH